jgi:hypothetical protein
LGLEAVPVSQVASLPFANFDTPPAFTGFFTLYGPNGYIEGDTKEEVEALTTELLANWPNALSGAVRKCWRWSQPPVWRVQIWSKIELA